MNDRTVKHLEAFYWEGTCSSSGIAADKLDFSQFSQSIRVGDLQDSLGRVLFDRTVRRAVLTTYGAALVPRVEALLNRADELAANMGTDPIVHGR